MLIPTYNERDNLPLIVERVRAAVPEADVVVLDDNSPDGTGEVADGLAATDDHVKVIHRQGKEGLGAAYLAGLALGVWPDRDTIAANWAEDSRFVPGPGQSRMQEQLAAWEDAVRRTRG